MKAKYLVMLIGSAFALNTANAGSLEITNCSLSEFSYTYAVENGETGTIQMGSLSDENISLEPSVVDIGTGSDEYDLTDDLPDANVFVTLVDGDEITTRICQESSD